ncbi:MAG: hypothetical protein E7439_01230 [Ruminococcaceae bacterium]|nr:hypothetical protein [Oscillospiraceae bacterium]
MIKWILSSSVLIGAVIGLRYLFRGKISAKLQYALWALVLVRLLMPAGIFGSIFSVENIVDLFQSQPAVQEVITDIQSPGMNYDDAFKQAKKDILPDSKQSVSAAQLTPDAAVKVYNRTSQLLQLSTPSFWVQSILLGIWYIGIAVVAICFLVSNIKFSRKLRRQRQLLKDEKVRVYTCEGLNTPCLFGIFRPAIYLTPEDAEDEQRSEHILAHERTHLRHWDHIWSLLRCVCLALHWYNPLVWIAAILSRRDSELACDEATVKHLGENQRIPYGETLVQTTCAAKSTTGLLGIATTMTGSTKAIKERVIMIAKKKKFSILVLTSVILVGAISIGCTWFGGNPDEEMVTVYLKNQQVLVSYSGNNTNTTTYHYDNNYNLTSQSPAAEHPYYYEYDEHNRIINKKDSDPFGKYYAQYTYNDQGQIVYCVSSSGRFSYEYDAHGRLISSTRHNLSTGIQIDYAYDSNGVLRSSQEVHSDGYKVYKTYDAQGNLTCLKRCQGDKVRSQEDYVYNRFGKLKSITKTDDGVVVQRYTFTYDLAGRLIKLVEELDTSIKAAMGIEHEVILTARTYTYRYDLSGNLLEESCDMGSYKTSTAYTYDFFDRLVSKSTDVGDEFVYTYDGNGNILTQSRYRNGELRSVVTYTYIAVQVTRKDAERLLAQQEKISSTLVRDMASLLTPDPETFYP